MGSRIGAWRPLAFAAAIAASLALARTMVVPLLPVRPAAAAEELALGREQVRELQRRLKAEGFDPGPVDGLVGRKTRAAIRRFREARGLGSDAGIDAALLEALGMQAARAPGGAGDPEEANNKAEEERRKQKFAELARLEKQRIEQVMREGPAGRLVLSDFKAEPGGTVGSLTMRAVGDSLGLSFPYPGDNIQMSDAGFVPKPVIPRGAGSVWRFVGKVPAGEYVFEGDDEEGLAFLFTEQGLVFLHGRGRVTFPDGRVVELDDPLIPPPGRVPVTGGLVARERGTAASVTRAAPEHGTSERRAATDAISRARAAKARGDLRGALEIVEEAVAEHPDDVGLLAARADLLESLDRLDEALEVWNRILELAPGRAEFRDRRDALAGLLGREHTAGERRGQQRSEAGGAGSTAEASAPATDVRPEPRTAADERAAAEEAEERGDLDAALRHYDRALELDPKLAAAWSNRGNVLDHLGRHAEALSSFERALELDPKDAAAWSNRGNVLDHLGRHAEALSSHDRALELDPKLAEAWTNRGVVLGLLGRLEEARASFEKAAALGDADARRALAILDAAGR